MYQKWWTPHSHGQTDIRNQTGRTHSWRQKAGGFTGAETRRRPGQEMSKLGNQVEVDKKKKSHVYSNLDKKDRVNLDCSYASWVKKISL